MTIDHLPVLYRPEGECRDAVPTEVCDTCSLVAVGWLVPASSCGIASVRSDELSGWLEGAAERPWWVVTA